MRLDDQLSGPCYSVNPAKLCPPIHDVHLPLTRYLAEEFKREINEEGTDFVPREISRLSELHLAKAILDEARRRRIESEQTLPLWEAWEQFGRRRAKVIADGAAEWDCKHQKWTRFAFPRVALRVPHPINRGGHVLRVRPEAANPVTDRDSVWENMWDPVEEATAPREMLKSGCFRPAAKEELREKQKARAHGAYGYDLPDAILPYIDESKKVSCQPPVKHPPHVYTDRQSLRGLKEVSWSTGPTVLSFRDARKPLIARFKSDSADITVPVFKELNAIGDVVQARIAGEFVFIDWRGVRVRPPEIQPPNTAFTRENHPRIEHHPCLSERFYILERHQLLEGHGRELVVPHCVKCEDSRVPNYPPEPQFSEYGQWLMAAFEKCEFEWDEWGAEFLSSATVCQTCDWARWYHEFYYGPWCNDFRGPAEIIRWVMRVPKVKIQVPGTPFGGNIVHADFRFQPYQHAHLAACSDPSQVIKKAQSLTQLMEKRPTRAESRSQQDDLSTNSGLDLLNREVEGVTEDTPDYYFGVEAIETEVPDQVAQDESDATAMPRLFTENEFRAWVLRGKGLNTAQIADEMGYSESAVRGFLRRAMGIVIRERERRFMAKRRQQRCL